MHVFDRYSDHDYQFERLGEEERGAHSMSRCSTAHHGDVRTAPRVYLGRRPAKSHENYFESKDRIEQARSGEIEFAVEG